MAVAGINNVSVLESSFLVDTYSSVSRRWANQEKPITRTSFIRNMWRDLEGESRFNENGRQQASHMSNPNTGSLCSCSSEGGAESEDASIDTNEVENECPRDQNQMGLQNGQEDNANSCLHRSPAFGVADKQRVRQVFREWGSKSFSGHASNISHMNNECKRVRIVREWIESSTNQADTGHSGIEEQATERGGLGVNHGVGVPSSIRRLYGRQVLLDLLTKFERERKIELQSLLENRLVSNFAHRNRIQALLRGRFLWNQRFVQDEKSTSIAASELGLLRQTHAVSDLRKGFLSRSDSHEHTPDGPPSDTSSDNGMKYHEEHFQELPDNIVNKYETTNTGSDIDGINEIDMETNTYESPQEYASPGGESHEGVLQNEGREHLSFDVKGSVEMNQGVLNIESSHETLGFECITQGTILHRQDLSDEGELEVNEASDHLDPLETNVSILSWQEGSEQVEEWQEPITEDYENIESDEGLDGNSFENEHEWYQESHDEWYDNGLEETTESWFGGTSYQEAAPVHRTDAFITFDDDNRNRLELQELMSRRRVSNLLQSDFRVTLDHLVQSYVERQDQAFESEDEWMLEREQEDQDPQSIGENDSLTEVVEGAEGVHPSLPAVPQIHQADQHFETEWEMINGLRFDMIMLQERMNTMQKTLETCMNMQLELQRSVQQEVSSALNRSSNLDEAKWNNGNEGVCFLCCDTSFNSSPNRCGHVYVCGKCAEKINWSKLKESVRHP